MKKNLTKCSMILVMVLAMSFVLMGCSKEKTITLRLEGIGAYNLISYPQGITGGVTEDGVTVTLEKKGEYELVFQDESGNKYTVTLTYDKNGVAGSCEDDGITGLEVISE